MRVRVMARAARKSVCIWEMHIYQPHITFLALTALTATGECALGITPGGWEAQGGAWGLGFAWGGGAQGKGK